MATVLDENDPNQQDPNNPSGPSSSAQSGTISGAGAGGASGPSSSGRFTNIQKYLQANQGYNQDSGGLAGQVAKSVNDTSQGVKSATDSASQAFQQQAQQGAQSYQGGFQQAQSIASKAPDQLTDDDYKQFDTLRNARYQGPNSLQDTSQYGTLQQNAQNAQQLAGSIGTEYGQQTLLSRLYGGQNYNQGQQRLDNLFLGADPNAAATLNSAKSNALQTLSQANDANQQAAAQASQYSANAKDVSSRAQDLANQNLTGFQSDLNNRVKSAAEQQASDYSRVLGGLKNEQISAADAQALGIDPNTNFHGLDVSQFLAKNSGPTAATVANSQDYSKYNALAKLAGTNPTEFDPTNTAQAGTFKGLSLDKDSLNNALGLADKSYNSKLNELNSGVSTAQQKLDQMNQMYDMAQQGKFGTQSSMIGGQFGVNRAAQDAEVAYQKAQQQALQGAYQGTNANARKQAQIAAYQSALDQMNRDAAGIGNSGIDQNLRDQGLSTVHNRMSQIQQLLASLNQQ